MQGTSTLIRRSVRFGAAVTIAVFALATIGTLAVYRDGAASGGTGALLSLSAAVESTRGGLGDTSSIDAPAMAANRGAAGSLDAIGGDERAVFEGEPAPESTVQPAPVATLAAVTRQPASTPVASAAPAPTAVETPEPRVYASRATVYDAVTAAFPEQPDRAYRIVLCESSANAHANTGNGYFGLWQFDLATWRSVGGAGLPSEASVEEQVARARALYDRRGWSPWECAS